MQDIAGTSNESGTELTQCRSLGVLARDLARLRPAYSQDAQYHISNLIEQCRNYQYNPQGLRPLILRTIERLSALLKNEA